MFTPKLQTPTDGDMQMVREKGYRGDTLPTSGYGWPASILLVGHQMAAGDLRREQLRVGAPGGGVDTLGFRIPKGAYPPDSINCLAPGSRSGLNP